MSEYTTKHTNLETELKGAGKGAADGMAEMTRWPAERGDHVSEQLPQPVTDAFGTFGLKWNYTEGCTVDEEFIGKGIGELVLGVETSEGKKRVVSIGQTPAEWDPSQGGVKRIEGAGDPGRYLMVVTDQPGQTDQTQTYRYLDAEDFTGVVAKYGEALTFSQNPNRVRQVSVSGTVKSAVGLLAAK